jgi:UDP-N-acetylmuramyl pentapeptide synthase
MHACVLQITGIATDSRRIRSGELFACIEGAYADGHHFIPHAISQGCPLIIAKLMIPGAELALYTDADPDDPELADLYREPYYQLAENDALTLEACSDEMAKWYDKIQGFGQKNKLKEEDIEKIQMAGAMRCISSALNYNFDHWENPDGVRSHLPTSRSHSTL